MNSWPVVLWRLVVAGCAAAGVVLAAREYDVWWTALSQLANLTVAVAFLGLAVAEPRTPWLRGGLVTLMLLVGLAYLPMQNGNLTQTWSLLEHVVTPALVVADFLLVGRNHHQMRWWYPLSWLAPPAAYLAWYVGGDLGVYAALDPARPSSFTLHVAVLVGLVLGCGFALYREGLRRGRALEAPVRIGEAVSLDRGR
ncbi:hypothetical protein [Nocardioides insulae]|uniref:hypothetical protein n=1 Tax=Nocardioides insulae TaxID=394734 RepID=UPI0004192822|nr:hypothetical protein [Nocardioides insulae]